MFSCAWLWIYVGCALMLMELMVPGFVVFFFGLSAATVGLCRFMFGEGFSGTWQLAAFSAFAVFYILVLRRYLKAVFSGRSETSKTDFSNDLAGRTGTIVQAIEPPHAGRALIGDAEWTAVADRPVAAGREVKVISQNNITLKVEEI